MFDVLFLQGITLEAGQAAAGTAITPGQITSVVLARQERVASGRMEAVVLARQETIAPVKT